MSIAEAVQAAITIKPKRCRFATVLDLLDHDDAAAIRDGLTAGLAAAEAARILRSNGHQVSSTITKDHLAGSCCCQDVA